MVADGRIYTRISRQDVLKSKGTGIVNFVEIVLWKRKDALIKFVSINSLLHTKVVCTVAILWRVIR